MERTMSVRHAVATWSIGRKLAYGYAAWGIALLVVLALRAATLEAWFWRAVMLSIWLVVSLRSALVYAHRKKPSKLSWWLRPGPAELNYAATWLVYAVVFGALSLLILVI